MQHNYRNFQALELIPKLREQMPIERAKMRIRLWCPSSTAKIVKEKVENLIQTVETESWTNGELDVVGFS